MEEFVDRWLFDPTVGKIVTAVVGILIIITLIANDNWMEFTVRYVVDYKKRRGTKDRLFTRILDEIDKTNGGVALASATFHLVETPVFDVRLADKISTSKS